MSGKHTPGPWSAFIGSNTIAVCIGSMPNGKRPCIVDWAGFDSCDLPREQQVANARLIASAPALLDALLAQDLYVTMSKESGLPLPEDPRYTAFIGEPYPGQWATIRWQRFGEKVADLRAAALAATNPASDES